MVQLSMSSPDPAKLGSSASEPRLTGVPDASSPLTRPEACDVAEGETRRVDTAVVCPELASPNSSRDVMTFALRVVVLTSAVLLCTLLGFHWGWHRAKADYTYKPKSVAVGNSAGIDSLVAVGTSAAMSGQKVGGCDTPSRQRPAVGTAPAGSLLIYENGKEVFRKLPSAPGEKQNAERAQ